MHTPSTLVAAILPFLFALSYAAPTSTTMKSVLPLEPRVVGGKPARDGQIPYQVMLIARAPEGSYLCGGAVMTSRFVLTAAHCVHGLTSHNIQLYAGNINRDKQDWVSGEVRVIHEHQNYNEKRYNNDIALLELMENLPIDGYKIAPLSVRSTEVPAGTNCVISGWGSMKEGGDGSKILQYVSIPVMDRRECSDLLGKSIVEGELCAGFKSGGKDSCQGDSGGPLVCDGLLTGVVSWGDGCAQKNKPGVYTNILHYSAWLQEIMGPEFHMKEPTTTTLTPRGLRGNQQSTFPTSTKDRAYSVTPLHHVVVLMSALILYFR